MVTSRLKSRSGKRYRYQQVHLLVQFTVVGGERATFLVHNINTDFETQLNVVALNETRLHKFYLALLRKAKTGEGRVIWNPDVVDIEGLTKFRSFVMQAFPKDYSEGGIDVVL